MNKGVVVWDWNGTLLDDLWAVVEATNYSIEFLTDRTFSISSYRDRFYRPIRQFHEEWVGFRFADAEWSEVNTRYWRCYTSLVSSVQLSPGALESLERLCVRGYIQSLVSMSSHAVLLKSVKLHGIFGCFESVQGIVSPAIRRKSELLPMIRESAAYPFLPLTMIGDTTDDADCARLIGASCILVSQSSFESNSRLATCNVMLVETLREAVLAV